MTMVHVQVHTSSTHKYVNNIFIFYRSYLIRLTSTATQNNIDIVNNIVCRKQNYSAKLKNILKDIKHKRLT